MRWLFISVFALLVLILLVRLIWWWRTPAPPPAAAPARPDLPGPDEVFNRETLNRSRLSGAAFLSETSLTQQVRRAASREQVSQVPERPIGGHELPGYVLPDPNQVEGGDDDEEWSSIDD